MMKYEFRNKGSLTLLMHPLIQRRHDWRGCCDVYYRSMW